MITGVKRDHTKTVQVSDGKYARYLEPKLRHEPLLQDGKPAGSRAVTWVSLPYFSLEPYSGLQATANSPKSLATPTLLQARYSRTRRARDMEQAVCQHGGAPKGHCFHVAQLWCLVLDSCACHSTSPSDSSNIPLINFPSFIALLLTYGRIAEDVLCADIITKTVKPLHNPPDPMPSKKTLSVRFRGAIMWSIPTHECQTWFVSLVPLSCGDVNMLTIVIQSFVSHFRNYQPWRLQFFHQKTAIKPHSWPRLYRFAVRPDKKLILDLHLRQV